MKRTPVNLAELRARAERAITRGRALTQDAEGAPEDIDISQLLEEQRIYQAELEIQNQELNAAQAEITLALGKYRMLFETLPLPALLVDAMGFIMEVNQQAVQQLGLRRMTSLNRLSVYQLFEPEGRTALYALLHTPQGCEPGRVENAWLRHEHGPGAPHDVHVIHHQEADGEEPRHLLVLVDKSGELALRESELRFRSFTDTRLTLLRATDADQQPEYFNLGWLDFVGLDLQQALKGDAWKTRLHPGEAARVLHAYADCFGQRQPCRLDYRLRRRDDQYRWIRDEGMPRRDSAGRFIGYVHHCLDISDLVEARQELATLTGELRLKEERLRLAMEATREGLWDWNLQTGDTFCNPAYFEMLGYEPGELAPNADALWVALLHPEDRDATVDAARERLRNEGHYELEFRLRTKDGGYRWIASQGQVVTRDATGEPLRAIGTHTDITERKLAEFRLRAISNYSRSLIEASLDPLVTISPEGRIMDVNTATETVTGRPRGDLIGSDFTEYFTEPDRARAGYRQVFAKGFVTDYPLSIRHADGRVTEVLYNASIYRDEAGQIAGVFAAARDVTQRNRIEAQLRELNASLEEKVAERTAQLARASEAKSEFLANMSHEIRTPMNAILGLTQLLEHEALTEDQRDILHKIGAAGSGLLHIINDILDFSKIEAGQLKVERYPFDPAAILTDLETVMAITARDKGLTLVMRGAENLSGALMGDPLRIKQVLINLVGNAIKFTEQGQVEVVAAVMACSISSTRLRFEVRDTGIGIPPEALARLFQPFSQAEAGTTRRFGGTGLGLSISKRLVELMGGDIGARSTTGQGSTFWFELPFQRTGAEPAASAPPAAQAPPPGPRLTGLRVLAVDDNRVNLFMLERALQREGANVTLATDGLQALRTLRASPRDFDLVLMDIQMPVLDGLAATREIRADAQLAHLPVIALTAGVLAEEREAAIAAGMNDFLAKPLDLETMTQTLERYSRLAAQ